MSFISQEFHGGGQAHYAGCGLDLPTVYPFLESKYIVFNFHLECLLPPPPEIWCFLVVDYNKGLVGLYQIFGRHSHEFAKVAEIPVVVFQGLGRLYGLPEQPVRPSNQIPVVFDALVPFSPKNAVAVARLPYV
jgi:hypothetical protein